MKSNLKNQEKSFGAAAVALDEGFRICSDG
jgi:hypothetical protein